MDIKLTTGFDFQGYQIVDYLGIVSGECVISTGILNESFGALSDILGTTSDSFSAKLNQAREYALDVIGKRAEEKTADAVIGIHFEYITLGRNMICVCCSGTAVRLEVDRITRRQLEAIAMRDQEEALRIQQEIEEEAKQTDPIGFLKTKAAQCDSVQAIKELIDSVNLPLTPEAHSLFISISGMADVERHFGVKPKAVQSALEQINRL